MLKIYIYIVALILQEKFMISWAILKPKTRKKFHYVSEEKCSCSNYLYLSLITFQLFLYRFTCRYIYIYTHMTFCMHFIWIYIYTHSNWPYTNALVVVVKKNLSWQICSPIVLWFPGALKRKPGFTLKSLKENNKSVCFHYHVLRLESRIAKPNL